MRGRILGTLTGAAIAALAACDLAPNAAQLPASFEILPKDTILKEGDTAKLRLLFYDKPLEDKDKEEVAKPSWVPVEWHNDAGRFSKSVTVTGDGHLVANSTGKLSVTAYVGDWKATVSLRISPESVLLTVPSFYLNQANQDPDGSVALVAGRDALLRVFLMGNGPSYFQPSVRVTFHQDGEEVYTTTIAAPVEELPIEVHQGRRDHSYNAIIPGHVLQPGVEMVIDIDPEGRVPTEDGSVTRIPPSGRMELDVTGLKMHYQTIVPTHFSWRQNDDDNPLSSIWMEPSENAANIRLLRTWLPIGAIEASAHSILYSDAETNQTIAGFEDWVNEVRVLWADNGEIGYYYGVANPGFNDGDRLVLGGLAANIGYPHVSVGSTRFATFVHEVGHSMNLFHAPCGGARGPDPNFPHDSGGIGWFGWDPRKNSLVDADGTFDFMGYCGLLGLPEWVSDYHFERAMDYRVRTEGTQERPPVPPKEPTLLLWGSAYAGNVSLDPAFMIDLPPTELPPGGPYNLAGFGPSGEERFSFDFTPMQLVDADGAIFFFALPYDPESDGTLERIELSGPHGEDVLTPGSEDFMAIVRDGEDGTIRAFLRDWDGNLPAGIDGAITPYVHLSDGIPGGAR